MASYTTPSDAELREWLRDYEIGPFDAFFGVAGGSVNSNFDVRAGGRRYFLRVYEEQDQAGARADAELSVALVARGVLTPTPVATHDGALVGLLAAKPAALLAWVEGEMKCQSSVIPDVARVVGAELAKVHGAGVEGSSASRFGAPQLVSRVEQMATDPRFAKEAPRLERGLLECDRSRDRSLPSGLIHGDLFRDNVLWNGTEIAALLDFESACQGPYVYDLAVTLLAWCYGDLLERSLVSALVGGYEGVRPLSASERTGLYEEARFAALRFTITRITDYAIRGSSGGARVMKDWRRFEKRKQLLDAMGPRAFEAMLG